MRRTGSMGHSDVSPLRRRAGPVDLCRWGRSISKHRDFPQARARGADVEQTHNDSCRTLAVLAGGALLLCITIFWRLGPVSFWDPDEAHYAETTREMLRSGDWLAPYYNGRPFFDKPIYFH